MRRYVKRVWRVPKDRGALEFIAVLVVKLLVKHGWPADWKREPFSNGFVIVDKEFRHEASGEFAEAVEVAARIIARTYRADLQASGAFVEICAEYEVLPRGVLREIRT